MLTKCIDVGLMYDGRFQVGPCQWGIPGANSASHGRLAPTFKSYQAMQPESVKCIEPHLEMV